MTQIKTDSHLHPKKKHRLPSLEQKLDKTHFFLLCYNKCQKKKKVESKGFEGKESGTL